MDFGSSMKALTLGTAIAVLAYTPYILNRQTITNDAKPCSQPKINDLTVNDECDLDAPETPRTPPQSTRPMHDTMSAKKASRFSLAFAHVSEDYNNIFAQIDVDNKGVISKSDLIQTLKATPALRVLADSMDDLITIAIEKIVTADTLTITKAEYDAFVNRMVTNTTNSKTESRQSRYSLCPQDFYAILDQVD